MIWNRFAVSLLMVACLACASGEELVERNNAAADVIRTNSKAFETAFNARHIEGMVGLMAEEYIDWNQAEPLEVVVAGDWAMVRGEFTLMSDGGSPPLEHRYMELWGKQEDGTWRLRWGMDATVPNRISVAPER